MDLIELKKQLEAQYTIIKSLAISAYVEEHILASAESSLLSLLEQARASELTESMILSEATVLLQTFITISEIYEIPLTDETESLLRRAKALGISFRELHPRQPSRPLSDVPESPPEHSIFVDESGIAAFDDALQPVLCLVGIIVKDRNVPEFEHISTQLLEKHNLTKSVEFHAQELLKSIPKEPLNKLPINERYELLREFIVLGMKHIEGVHHFSMLKSMVKPEFKMKMVAQGLNAYTHLVVWFLITLDRACLLIRIGSRFKYFFDRTDAYRKDIARIFKTLGGNNNLGLKLYNLEPPMMLDSRKSRFIQLADAVGYYLNRYRQFEVKAFRHRKELEKHKDKIFEVYELIRPKIVNFIGRDLLLTVDWKALNNFSIKNQLPSIRTPKRKCR